MFPIIGEVGDGVHQQREAPHMICIERGNVEVFHHSPKKQQDR